MARQLLAYVFERFPTFTQTFCIREVLELERQGLAPLIFSIRDTGDEPIANFPTDLRERVHVLPQGGELIDRVKQLKDGGHLPQCVVLTLRHWKDRPDKMRVYEAAYIGHQIRQHSGSHAIEHAHSHFAGVGARCLWWMRRFYGIGYSFTGHANDIFCQPAEPVIPGLKSLVRDAAFVPTVSEHSGRFLREQFPDQSGKVIRVFNGLDLDQFSDSTQAGAARGIGGRRIVSIGRLIEKKGFPDLIRACAELSKRQIDYRCDIVGDGPMEEELQDQINAAGIGDRVTLRGKLGTSDIVDLLQSDTHIFALPCIVESDGGMDNLPTVIMEAMAAGVPCVSTRLAGVPEMIDEGETGLIVEPGDVPALSDALVELLSDEALSKEMGLAGTVVAAERFALPVTAKQLRELFVSRARIPYSSEAGSLGNYIAQWRRRLTGELRRPSTKVRDKSFDLVSFMGGTEGDS